MFLYFNSRNNLYYLLLFVKIYINFIHKMAQKCITALFLLNPTKLHEISNRKRRVYKTCIFDARILPFYFTHKNKKRLVLFFN